MKRHLLPALSRLHPRFVADHVKKAMQVCWCVLLIFDRSSTQSQLSHTHFICISLQDMSSFGQTCPPFTGYSYFVGLCWFVLMHNSTPCIYLFTSYTVACMAQETCCGRGVTRCSICSYFVVLTGQLPVSTVRYQLLSSWTTLVYICCPILQESVFLFFKTQIQVLIGEGPKNSLMTSSSQTIANLVFNFRFFFWFC